MYCLNCSIENSEGRKFCRECGSSIMNLCRKCGFINSLTDKYCGGCGTGLQSHKKPASEDSMSPDESLEISGKYSKDDISELFDRQSKSRDKDAKKKDTKDTDEVSQELIDLIFGPDDKEKTEKDKEKE
ncbi:MAG: zinc ribbon domain-containing protein [Nitrospirota bacterium]